ncbi:MAG TPA: ATP-binding cassette domain-containing protein [Bacteroidales bacterium]|jgi:ABC-type multidrug transport system ATPase subunit|nr:ATP-binding cassette domain-containing protein [Bacteroidales bacterium]
MEVRLENTGKKFSSGWVFNKLNYIFESGSATAITGRNGSGKSTLLQVIAGNFLPSAGKVTYVHRGNEISGNTIFRHLSVAAPYQELIEEFTLEEMLTFHFSLKKMAGGYTIPRIIDLLQAGEDRHRPLREFSSGMKQRVRLACALLCDTPLLLLDEPATNLDREGIAWYQQLVTENTNGKTVIVCSNLQQSETEFCNAVLCIEEFHS